ncbi:carbon-monoxide dehydrogenase medium subunit [Loktanella fryxellensis]|uniref:Carbon-monoxide dehydrogenase medium subunit n=1 Tax=Loktanella fryxellensis TaxID=245187 RepID=A0A1H8C4K9_9RHOB|nr:xanthine dehydrogenase family protein subunit M [Loktanella fryxellensis]SEM89394.1 carbon-monoxide dehydrogenase medium subunit [Loktanella fryxellensis]
MKASVGGYARATDLRHALDLLAAGDGSARILAGGQSLIAALNMRLSTGDLLIDINRIDALKGITCDGSRLRIGALTRHAEIAVDPLVARHAPLLRKATDVIAHAAIRNRGTIGGAVAHADPAAEFPACVLALDGIIHVEGPDGARDIPAADFFVDVFETTIAPDEILTAISLPVAEPDERQVIHEFGRRSGDYALAGVCLVRRAAGHRIVCISVATRPELATAAMARLDAGDPDGAVAALEEALDPPSDTQATAAYRRHLAGVMLRRAVADITGETA